jgi:hypothetical protein
MKYITLLLIALFYQTLCADTKYTLSILTIFQNEAPYLKEWIDFHRSVGIEHFYLINHLSTDNFKDILQPYMDQDIVELFQCTENNPSDWNGTQVRAYDALLPKLQDETKWVAILDTDEFLFAYEEKDLKQFLKSYENNQIGGIYVFWQCYGTSFQRKIPSNKSLIESLILKAPTDYELNKYGKSIVRPDRCESLGIHVCGYKPGYHDIKANGEAYDGTSFHASYEKVITQTIDISQIRINHYWTRDENYFRKNKIPRYRKWRNEIEAYIRYIELNKIEDKVILDFINS